MSFFLRLCAETDYKKPENISENSWNAVTPYLLPADHPAKKILDRIFSSARASGSSKALKSAGFQIEDDKEQDLIVAKHPLLKGYVIKLYYDDYDIPNSSEPVGEPQTWINRIIGVQRVRESIQRHHLEDLFTTPRKWIYPLPENPLPSCTGSTQCFPKNFILVSDDMHLVSHAKNIELYKTAITKRHLEGLYTIIKETHLWDSVYIDNNIFTESGKIAFIDTEDFDAKPIKFQLMTASFSPEMQAEWIKLVKERGEEIPAKIR